MKMIRGLPVQRRLPEAFEMAVYENRDVYTGVLKFCALYKCTFANSVII